jgi:hypothetical protein
MILRGTDVLVRQNGPVAVGLGSLDAAASTPSGGPCASGNIEEFRRQLSRQPRPHPHGNVGWRHAARRADRISQRGTYSQAVGGFLWFDPDNNQDTRVTFGRDGAATVVIVRDGAEMFRSSRL